MGLVYNPVLEDMYTTIRGQGAFCNGKKIHVTEGGISEAVINCGCTYCTDTCNMMLSNSSRFALLCIDAFNMQLIKGRTILLMKF